MKKKKNLSIYLFLLMGISFFIAYGCSSKDDNMIITNLQDADGNVYHVDTIGTQIWMVENLKTTHYNDNSPITQVTDPAAWTGLTTAAYCWYSNDAGTYKNTYGALYNWYAVNSGKLCPAGWHVPSDAEWTTLINYLGGTTMAGGKLKETGTAHWATPNTGADNRMGFTALPGGSRFVGTSILFTNGVFYANGSYGFWWSSTENASKTTEAWHQYLTSGSAGVVRQTGSKGLGFSVRCIKN
jgi:uncharacterized protein (TIGR02145 family)